MNTTRTHIPVLLKEVIQSLHIQKKGIYVDGTFGAGGYSEAILNTEPTCHVIAIDQDETAIAAGEYLKNLYKGRLILIHGRFGDMERLINQPVDGIVLDIGVSSMQIDNPERGFSFQKDGPLDMRMHRKGMTAGDVINTFKEKELADIIYHYGEEKLSRKIASKIVQRRQDHPFISTLDLAQVIRNCTRNTNQRIDGATRTFQALRVFINDELSELSRGLNGAKNILKDGGFLSVVSFHSLEDRIVKDFFLSNSRYTPNPSKYLPDTPKKDITFNLITKKAIIPSDAEKKDNPRARSAHLRIGKRIRS